MAINRILVARVAKVAIAGISGEWRHLVSAAATQAVETWANAKGKNIDLLAIDIESWATPREISEASVTDALKIMEPVLAEHPVTLEDIIDSDRDPEKLSRLLMKRGEGRFIVRGPDGRPIHANDAQPAQVDRETRETCEQIGVIVHQHLLADPEIKRALDSAEIQALARRGRARARAEEHATAVRDEQLRQSLHRYLQVLIQDLSTDLWPRMRGEGHLSVTDLERPLLLLTGDVEPTPADDVADASEHLVILGDPGAGKTWLAWRIARRAAHNALARLACGIHVDDVEIPLLLTCQQFRTAAGSPRDAAVEPGLDSRSDFGVTDALKDFLRNRDRNVLLVLDSLDEASSTGGREIDQALIGSWRTVVTSRPAAWQGQWDRPGHTITQAQLAPLDYHRDVVKFVQAWFTTRYPDGGKAGSEALLLQLQRNPHARELSVTPLFLTFLCLVADAPLPSTRRELLENVANRLLEWRAHRLASESELSDVLRVARQWAWDAARNEPISGISQWSDDFIPERPTKHADVLDSIAPATNRALPGTGGAIQRRFVHRTIREHLVATRPQPLDEAARQIAIHWYCDGTWSEIIPTMIVQHPERDALLDRLLRGPAAAPPELAHWVSRWSDGHVLRIAAESRPDDWSPVHREAIHAVRIRNPRRAHRSRQWARSNPDVMTELTRYLRTHEMYRIPDVPDVARALVELDPTTRIDAVTALTQQIHDISPGYLPGFAQALAELATTDATKADAVTALIQRLPHAEESTPYVARALVELDPTSRTDAVTALLRQLPDSGQQTVEAVRVLVDLDPKTRAQAVASLTQRLPYPGQERENLLDMPFIARALVELDPATRSDAVTALKQRLSDSGPWFHMYIRTLVELDPETRTDAVTALAEQLPDAWVQVPHFVAYLLVELATDDTTKAAAVAALSRHLFHVGSSTAFVAEWLVHLDPTARSVALTALTERLAGLNGSQTDFNIAPALVRLATTDATRSAAITALTRHLPHAGRGTPEAALALVELYPAARPHAITALSTFLPRAQDRTVSVARALVELCLASSRWQRFVSWKVGDGRMCGAGVDVVGPVPGQELVGPDLVVLDPVGLGEGLQLDAVSDLVEEQLLVLQRPEPALT